MDLRPYQREALEAVKRAYRAGRRRVIISLPTGTGKTVVFAHFPTAFAMKKRLLVLAHREELLEQAVAKFRAVDPSLTVEVEQASRRAGDAQVVVASVPTIGRAGSSRLLALNPETFSVIVVDEAHHAVAQSYRTIFEHFGLFEPASTRMLVGFTATPRRGDKQGLGDVFEEVAYARELREMIGAGFLARVIGWRVATTTSLEGIKTRAGDFVERELAAAVDTEPRNDLVVRAFLELAHSRRAIVFCVNVAHAQHLADVFTAAGVRSSAVWGDMGKDERRDVLARFSRGDLQLLTNCNLLTEGFDEPRVDCVVMARPTKSRLLYAQMVGRGTRLHPDKQDLLVIDIADNSRTHTVPQLGSLFALPETMNLRGADALTVEARLRDVSDTYPWVDVSRIETPEQMALAVESIDFFNFEPPPELPTRLLWAAMPAGGYRLSLPRGEWMQIDPTLVDTFEVRLCDALLGTTRTLKHAVQLADSFVREKREDALKLVQRDAGWHDQAPSEKQLALLAQKGVPIPRGLSRGQASRMIGLLLARH